MSRKSKESIKRLLAIALTFVMVAGMLPFTAVSAFAEETPAPDQTTDVTAPADGEQKETKQTEDIKDETTPLDAGDTTTDPTTDPVVTMNPVEGLVYKKDVAQELLESVNVQPGYTVEKYTVVKDGDSTTSTDYTDIADIKATDAGRYTITATYKADGATVPETVECTVDIAKAQQTITFSNDGTADTVINTEDTIELDFNNAPSLDYAAFINEQYEQGDGVGKISFALMSADDTEIESPDIAYDKIDENKQKLRITFTEVGEYKLVATVKGDVNHDENTASLKFSITDKNKDKGSIIIADNVSQLVKLEGKKFSFNAEYTIDPKYKMCFVTAELIAPEGIKEKFSTEVGSNAIKITAKNLDDIDGLIGTIIQLKITLNKWSWGGSSEVASKTINITLNYGTNPLSEDDFVPDGKLNESGDWYVMDGDVAPTIELKTDDPNKADYTISDTLAGNFKKSCNLPEGNGVQVFVKDKEGYISKFQLSINADYKAPETTIDQSKVSVWDKIWNNISFGATDPKTYNLDITSTDNMGVKEIHVKVKSASLDKFNSARNELAEIKGREPEYPGDTAPDDEKNKYYEAHGKWELEYNAFSFENILEESDEQIFEVGGTKEETIQLAVNTDQICTVEFWAVDVAGIEETPHRTASSFDEEKAYDYLLIDNTAPEIELKSSNPDNEVSDIKYFGSSYFEGPAEVTVTATVKEANYDLIGGSRGNALTITVKENNAEIDNVSDANDVDENGNGAFDKNVSLGLPRPKENESHRYTVTATCTDPSGNTTTESMTIVIDTEKPAPSIALPEKAPISVYNKDAYTVYFNNDLALVLNVKDANPGTEMEVAPWKDADFDKVSLSDGTGTYTVTKDGKYNFKLKHTDVAGNSKETTDSITYIRDTVKPTVAVDLGGAARVEGDTHYYNGDINATVNVTEQYFDAGLIETKVDGTRRDVAFKTNADTNVSTSPVKITGDGEHRLSVSGSDKAGNEMEAYNSPRLVIDTTIHAPVIGGVANGKAYKDKDIAVNVTGDDTNLDAITVKITKATKDGTETVYSVSEANRSFTYAVPAGQAADGVYTVEATIRDKANNTAAAQTVTFTVNRFGSVYEFGAGVSDINGSHVKAVDNDIVISEYSVNKLKTPLEDNVKISINGKPVSSADVKVQEEHRAGGWYKYTYVIAATSFADDGYYKVEVSSTDSESGKTSGTARYADMGLAFFKDGTKPMIESVLGMEKPTYNENEHSIDFDVYDAIGLASVKVYVDGKEVFSQTDFEDASAFSGKIVLGELSSRQHIRFEIEDLAGNITNTDDDIEPFAPEFEFVPDITVSTNFFVRWYAQPGLFWGTVIGGAALIALVVILIAKKKKTGGEEE